MGGMEGIGGGLGPRDRKERTRGTVELPLSRLHSGEMSAAKARVYVV